LLLAVLAAVIFVVVEVELAVCLLALDYLHLVETTQLQLVLAVDLPQTEPHQVLLAQYPQLAVVLVVVVTELPGHILAATVVQAVVRQVLKVVACHLLCPVVQVFLGKVITVAQIIPIANLTVVVAAELEPQEALVQAALVVLALQTHYALILL
jgi:hypothetical protein